VGTASKSECHANIHPQTCSSPGGTQTSDSPPRKKGHLELGTYRPHSPLRCWPQSSPRLDTRPRLGPVCFHLPLVLAMCGTVQSLTGLGVALWDAHSSQDAHEARPCPPCCGDALSQMSPLPVPSGTPGAVDTWLLCTGSCVPHVHSLNRPLPVIFVTLNPKPRTGDLRTVVIAGRCPLQMQRLGGLEGSHSHLAALCRGPHQPLVHPIPSHSAPRQDPQSWGSHPREDG
jgi:hypothetical protein